MYPVLLQIHHYLSYLVVLLAVYVTIKAWIGYTGKKRFLPADEKSGLVFSILFDIQVLAGLILYVFVSPITKKCGSPLLCDRTHHGHVNCPGPDPHRQIQNKESPYRHFKTQNIGDILHDRIDPDTFPLSLG